MQESPVVGSLHWVLPFTRNQWFHKCLKIVPPVAPPRSSEGAPPRLPLAQAIYNIYPERQEDGGGEPCQSPRAVGAKCQETFPWFFVLVVVHIEVFPEPLLCSYLYFTIGVSKRVKRTFPRSRPVTTGHSESPPSDGTCATAGGPRCGRRGSVGCPRTAETTVPRPVPLSS